LIVVAREPALNNDRLAKLAYDNTAAMPEFP
jgi:hypothetical protein